MSLATQPQRARSLSARLAPPQVVQQQATVCSHQHRSIAAAPAAAVAVAILLLTQPPTQQAQAAEDVYTLAPCQPGTSCVSSSSFMMPAQYLPPWSFLPETPAAAFRHVLSELEERGAVVVTADAAAGFIKAHLRAAGSSSQDVVQLRLRPDGVVLFRAEAAGPPRQQRYPAFCLTPGCISGPATRQQLEALRNSLGWMVLEPDDDKAWQQILLH